MAATLSKTTSAKVLTPTESTPAAQISEANSIKTLRKQLKTAAGEISLQRSFSAEIIT